MILPGWKEVCPVCWCLLSILTLSAISRRGHRWTGIHSGALPGMSTFILFAVEVFAHRERFSLFQDSGDTSEKIPLEPGLKLYQVFEGGWAGYCMWRRANGQSEADALNSCSYCTVFSEVDGGEVFDMESKSAVLPADALRLCVSTLRRMLLRRTAARPCPQTS